MSADAPALTIGMAHYDDYNGLWATIQSLRLYHADAMADCEILVVDNNPTSKHGDAAGKLVTGWVKDFGCKSSRYIKADDIKGTSAPRDLVFREAAGHAVMCMDCHVMLAPGAVAKLIDYYGQHKDTSDLLTGPMVYDDLKNISTHFRDEWGADMWGRWGTDKRGANPDGEPFEIDAMGLGLFTCRKEAWLGFNPLFRGFGGEEWYIHEKFRKAGAKCLCLPFLRWLHRFGRPDGVPYKLTRQDRMFNYAAGHLELGLPLSVPRNHFVNHQKVPYETWAAVVKEAKQATKAKHHTITPRKDTLETLFTRAQETPSDINQHLDRLRDLARQCESVTEFGHRPEASTVALLAGQPKRFHTYPQGTYKPTELAAHANETDFTILDGSSVEATIEPTDMLFIDTTHTYSHLKQELRRQARHVQQYIVLHDTEAFGETGEDGGPGLLHAVRWFAHENRDWQVVEHHRHNNGLTVLARPPIGRKKRPGVLRSNCQAIFRKHNPEAPDNANRDTLFRRLEWCTTCDQRDGCRCTVRKQRIGSFSTKQDGQCPLGKWWGRFEGETA